jgi:hypothetical protein
MYNLIQIQDAIKGLPTSEVMKYANGTNPSVPSYLALGELNRRKQLQDTAAEFYGEPSTVKDQITGSLTGAPQGMVDPTAAMQGVNPAAAPPQVNPATTPPQLATQQPGPVDPTAAPQPQMPPNMMAAGGLTSLPVDMFKQSNYAAGGIVAFTDGGSAFSEDVQRAEDWLREQGRKGAAAVESGVSGIESIVGGVKDYFTKPRPRDAESQEGGFYGKSGKDTGTPPVAKEAPATAAAAAPAPNPNRQLSNTTSGQLKQPQQTQMTPEESDEKMFARIERLNKLAGIEGDPYADLKKRYAAIEARRAEQAEGDTMGSIRSLLRGYAQANPTDSFGVQLAAGSDKMAAFDKETAALRDKQAADMAALQASIAKEELSRKQGNVKGVIEAQKEQKDIELKMRKLGIDELVAKAQLASFENRGSNAGLKENPLVTQATKYYFDNQMVPAFIKKYPTIGDYLKSQGLTPNSSVGGGTAPTVTSKAEFDKLPSGAIYTSTDGKQYRKP